MQISCKMSGADRVTQAVVNISLDGVKKGF